VIQPLTAPGEEIVAVFVSLEVIAPNVFFRFQCRFASALAATVGDKQHIAGKQRNEHILWSMRLFCIATIANHLALPSNQPKCGGFS